MILGAVNVIYKKLTVKAKNINGEVALITGSAQGLGKQIAIELAKKGCHLAVVDINFELAQKTSQELSSLYKIKSKAFKTDITQYDQVVKLGKDVKEQLGPVTILVNNAGMLTFKILTKPTPEETQNMINTNLTSHFYTIRVFMEGMRETGKGHIVAISSVAGLVPLHRQLEYTASKHGIRGLMKALHSELYTYNADFIKITTVFPYFLKTNARVDELFNKMQISNVYPNISAEEGSKAVVEGIVKNQMEVIIPSTFSLDYRLLELLPASWLAWLLCLLVSREKLRGLDNF